MCTKVNDKILIVVREGLQLVLESLEVFVPFLSNGRHEVSQFRLLTYKACPLGSRHKAVHVTLVRHSVKLVMCTTASQKLLHC